MNKNTPYKIQNGKKNFEDFKRKFPAFGNENKRNNSQISSEKCVLFANLVIQFWKLKLNPRLCTRTLPYHLGFRSDVIFMTTAHVFAHLTTLAFDRHVFQNEIIFLFTCLTMLQETVRQDFLNRRPDAKDDKRLEKKP